MCIRMSMLLVGMCSVRIVYKFFVVLLSNQRSIQKNSFEHAEHHNKKNEKHFDY